ncbi:MAG: PH domain-containing protein [Candidatus Curtissbacteria bacterium]|nr:PH domain-containing protein [Candidatus Curtissbacteria bacterium]
MNIKPPSASQRKRLAKLLGSGEEVIYVTSIGTRYFWIKVLTTLPLAFLIIGLPKLGNIIRMRQSYTYAITNRRFLIIRGILTRKIVTAPLGAITHITVEQSFIQRLFYNTGHLVIITAGFDQREIVIEHIADPVRFKILIEDLTAKLDNQKDEEEPQTKLRALSL